MKVLPADATDDQVLTLCREWVELMATNRLDGALDLLWIPPDYDESQHWTAASLRAYIENDGSWEPMRDGSKWRITSMKSARAPDDRQDFEPRANVVRVQRDRRAGAVNIDVPLNGQWSDLTAQLEFRPVAGGTAVSLYDLHVL